MKNKYYVLYNTGNALVVSELTKKELGERIERDKNGAYSIDQWPVSFVDELTKMAQDNSCFRDQLPHRALIIKGRIILPQT